MSDNNDSVLKSFLLSRGISPAIIELMENEKVRKYVSI